MIMLKPPCFSLARKLNEGVAIPVGGTSRLSTPSLQGGDMMGGGYESSCLRSVYKMITLKVFGLSKTNPEKMHSGTYEPIKCWKPRGFSGSTKYIPEIIYSAYIVAWIDWAVVERRIRWRWPWVCRPLGIAFIAMFSIAGFFFKRLRAKVQRRPLTPHHGKLKEPDD